MNVGVVGAAGRMGTAICAAIEADPDLVLSAKVDAGDELRNLVDGSSEVVVDVTNILAARKNLPWYALHGMHAVVGTTGFEQSDLDDLDRTYDTEGKTCFVVPNFAIGAVLMMRFAEQAANYFDGVEIIELHHERKKDAPSGTAALTASRIAASRTDPWQPDATEHASPAGVRGGEVSGIHVHSVRLPGFLAHQEVIFGTQGQTLTIRHDGYDRSAFMPGVILAIKAITTLPSGLTVGLDAIL